MSKIWKDMSQFVRLCFSSESSLCAVYYICVYFSNCVLSRLENGFDLNLFDVVGWNLWWVFSVLYYKRRDKIKYNDNCSVINNYLGSKKYSKGLWRSLKMPWVLKKNVYSNDLGSCYLSGHQNQ